MPCSGLGLSFARPKSRIFGRPSRVTKTFSGFRSRWTIPFSWAAERPSAHPGGQLESAPRRQRPAGEALSQPLSLEELEDEVGCAVVDARIEHRQELRVVERSRGARFLLEAAQPVGVRGDVRAQHLDRHLAAEPIVACTVDLAHPTGAQRPEHRIGTELGA